MGKIAQTTSTSRPLIPTEFLNRKLFYGKGGEKSGADLVRDAITVSTHLRNFDHIISDCFDRYFFTVLLLAGAIQNKTCLLPPNRAGDTLNALASHYKNTVFITDNAEALDSGALLVSDLVDTDSARALTSIPEIPVDNVIAIAFTSGSTGRPQAHPRTWGWALEEARAAGQALGLRKSRPQPIVCTTPAQHMYGFVASIFIPLTLGQISYRGRPFFPEEIRETLSVRGPESILATTPIQLRACVLSDICLPNTDQILSSAAPLDPDLAEQAEALYSARVVEFYGSTESGAIAIRRPTQEETWATFDGITVRSARKELEVSAPYLPGPVKLKDRVNILDKAHFQLLGRSADLIKIGGKRASLAELNSLLLSIEGVEDGAFVALDPSLNREIRLAALVVSPEKTAEFIISALSKAIDPVFLPRPIKLVERLPRTSAGKMSRQTLLELL